MDGIGGRRIWWATEFVGDRIDEAMVAGSQATNQGNLIGAQFVDGEK